MIFFAGIVCLTILDQWSKVAAAGALKGNKPLILIDGILEFSYLENTGTAWGLFGGGRVFFLVLTILIFAVILYVVFRLPKDRKYIPLLITSVLLGAGAVGNFIDRLFLGYVRDFVYLKWINFPVFNIADAYVTVGIVLFAVLFLFIYQEKDLDFLRFRKN